MEGASSEDQKTKSEIKQNKNTEEKKETWVRSIVNKNYKILSICNQDRKGQQVLITWALNTYRGNLNP